MSHAISSGGRLCISVTFLTGRYHGEEWPPSPARLFQALVAAVMTCGYQEFEATIAPALRWLEEQPAPIIRSCSVGPLGAYRIAVPNNDMDVVAWEWIQGRHKDVAVLKTMKQVAPRLLPEEGPHVQYIWAVNADNTAPPIDVLQTATHLLHTLGWGVDMAYADVVPEQPIGDLYEPAISGERWMTPMPGTYDDLKAAYKRFQTRSAGKSIDSFTRASALASQPYRRSGQENRPVVCFRLMRWQDPSRVLAVRWEDCRKVAAWLRHRAAEELRNEYDEVIVSGYLQGHIDSADKDKSQHISYVPLPTIYGHYADGAIRRAMIVEPAGMPGDVSEMIGRKLTGAVLTGTDGAQRCCLAPPETGDWTFRQYLPKSPCRVWRSVTPVVLHGHNTSSRGVISVAKTERLLLRALLMAGFQEEQIDGLAFQSGPFWPGSKHSAAMPVPAHLNGYPRLHVEVRFVDGIVGPVLAGIGRHYGIGLFAALTQENSGMG
jgi:CRISPR-associated protein Csb2